MNENLLLNFETRRCRRCVMPEVKGHLELDENGLCSLCREAEEIQKSEEKKFFNFDDKSPEEKKAVFLKKIERFRTGGKYDCMVAVSGGKDSIMTLSVAHELGLKVLALFVDNGFALPEMYDNIRNAADAMDIDWLTLRTTKMKKIFKALLESRKNIYYCRVCHILLEDIIKTTCINNNIRLVLGGYTKGQSYLKQNALSWIFEESDRNTLEVLRADGSFPEYIELFEDPIKYAMKNYRGVMQISPFKYLEYDEEKIIRTLQEKYNFRLPEKSWPAHSTNCSFNYVSQYLAVKQFGYSQHETEFSDLVRSGEMAREQAENLMNTPVTEKDLENALDVLGLTKDVI
ncbi:MAG: phosphoadenosine phosphosulfate reductase family protein [Ruminococcus sp.]|nr:phosphoadenosine phosphosulfate reductase family protein [Ruminococcus sp.]